MIRTRRHAYWLLALVLISSGLAGCGSSFSGNTGDLRVQALPVLLAANPVSVAQGQSATLTATFLGGTGIVTPGNISVTNGVAITVTPAQTTTYTLTVTSGQNLQSTATATVTVTPAPPPSIASFTAIPATLAAGGSASLTAVFSNGTGSVAPGSLAVTSGTPVTVSPTGTTTYTLTVTNTAGVTATASATVTVTPVQAAAAELGVNIGGVDDWDPTQMFADAMKQARKFGLPSEPWEENATVDALGWPTEDAGVLVVANNQGAWSAGTYALSFTGQATAQSWNDNNVNVGPVTYNPATNTSSATVTVGPAYQSIYLVFTNSKRTPTGATGSGVTNVSLMRPTINGTPHAPGTVFTDRFLARLKYFTAMRMMDYLATNGSTEANWSDRSIPAHASQQEVPPHTSQNQNSPFVTGASYEYGIQLANQTGKDLWLNVPHLTFGGTYLFPSTAWATNLALLLKYGSDAAGKPYTGLNGSGGANPQPASGPVNPGLNPGLHVYLEYSNEFWSGVGGQTGWIYNQAEAAIAANDPDLDWDHDTDVYDIEWRIGAKGTMLIANAFAGVYGSAAFGNVYRPVLGGQLGNTGTYWGLNYLDSQHGGANLYVWAAAGAPYVDFNGDVYGNTVPAAQVISGMQAFETADIVPAIQATAAAISAEHLQGGMVAYEGGQGALYNTPGSLAAQTMPAMRGITTSVLDAWAAQGGGTFFYYKLCSADNWGLARDISYDIDADPGYAANPADSTETEPKWGAIKQVVTEGK
jgi:hypothetical protein